MSNLWNVKSMKCLKLWKCNLWNVQSIKNPILKNGQSMKFPIYEMYKQWNVQFMKCISYKCPIYDLSNLWKVQAMKCPIYEMYNLWNVWKFQFMKSLILLI